MGTIHGKCPPKQSLFLMVDAWPLALFLLKVGDSPRFNFGLRGHSHVNGFAPMRGGEHFGVHIYVGTSSVLFWLDLG